jgi:excisionase family DNA binding protein
MDIIRELQERVARLEGDVRLKKVRNMQEQAQRLNVSASKLRELMREGRIKYGKHGRHYAFTDEQEAAYLAAAQVP